MMEDSVITRRVFVGIKVVDEIAKACKKLQDELKNLPVRFVTSENIHLTLLPPWSMDNQILIEKKLESIASQTNCFELNLIHLTSWPTNQHRYSRLIWIECAAAKTLCSLRNALVEMFAPEGTQHTFLPHITLARFNRKQTRQHYFVEKPVNLSMWVESIQLFEVPKEGGAYKILKSFSVCSGKN